MPMDNQQQILERGDVYFFYCPKTKALQNKKHKINQLAEVKNFFIILHPEDKSLYRLWSVDDKQLPDIEDVSRKSCLYSQAICRDSDEILSALDQHAKHDKGSKPFLAARPCGEGGYFIFNHQDHSHFAYSLNLPEKIGAVQQQLNIAKQANYVIAVKNQYVDHHHYPKVNLPSELLNHFHGQNSIAIPNIEFINYPNLSFILSNQCQIGIAELDYTSRFDRLFKDLAIWTRSRPTAPLLHGKWE